MYAYTHSQKGPAPLTRAVFVKSFLEKQENFFSLSVLPLHVEWKSAEKTNLKQKDLTFAPQFQQKARTPSQDLEISISGKKGGVECGDHPVVGETGKSVSKGEEIPYLAKIFPQRARLGGVGDGV